MTTNKIYQTPGTTVTFMNTGGDVTLTLKNTANGHGRVSNQWDRGAGALPARVKVEACIKGASAIAISAGWHLYAYAAQGGATLSDLTADADLTAETQLNNFLYIGKLLASSNAVGPFYGSWVVELVGRYVNLAVWNPSGQAIDNADGTSYIKITPMPDDIQAAA